MKVRQPDQRASAANEAKLVELERAVADERKHSAELRGTVNELRFKLEILEKSYAKQLEDAKRRFETAEQTTDIQRSRIAELDAARQDAIALLTETRVELDRLTAERDQLRRELAAGDGSEVDPSADKRDGSGAEGTINTLMNDAAWARAAAPRSPDRDDRAAAEAVDDEPAGELLAPELVLTAGRNRD